MESLQFLLQQNESSTELKVDGEDTCLTIYVSKPITLNHIGDEHSWPPDMSTVTMAQRLKDPLPYRILSYHVMLDLHFPRFPSSFSWVVQFNP